MNSLVVLEPEKAGTTDNLDYWPYDVEDKCLFLLPGFPDTGEGRGRDNVKSIFAVNLSRLSDENCFLPFFDVIPSHR